MNVRLIVVIAGLLAHSQLAYSQSNGLWFNLRRYVTELTLGPRGRFTEGVLYEVTDSTLTLAPIKGLKPKLNAIMSRRDGTLPPADSLRQLIPLKTYRYSQISLITLHRRGRAGKGFLVGMLVGVIAGFIHSSDPKGSFVTPGEYAALDGLALAVPGALVGAAMGKRINAKRQSIAIDVPRRFRKFSIVEQVNQANLRKPY